MATTTLNPTTMVTDYTENEQRSSFRTCDGDPSDGGGGTIRMSPSRMRKENLEDDLIVSITGKRRTLARLRPALAEAVPEDSIQMGGVIRSNAGIVIGELVLVERAAVRPASSVTLSPIGRAKYLFRGRRKTTGTRIREILGAAIAVLVHRHKPRLSTRDGRRGLDYDTQKLRDALLDRPVCVGDRLQVAVDGKNLDFLVRATRPSGAVTFDTATRLAIDASESSEADGPAVSYEDVGGLSAEIARVREMVELPLRCPEVFERLGVEAPKGILLYGPPGCGKTLIARAVAYEAGVRFVNINSPEIIQRGYGESEGLLREIFRQAQESPATIIFFDEIDALAPNRDTALGDVEKRVVAQLLALLDGINSRGRVIVIGATNLPNNIDPALRRPGRFDREIELGAPSREGRLQILQIHTRSMPFDADVDLRRLAEITHGFVGADLAALCREAAMQCVRDLMPKMNLAHQAVPTGPLDTVRVAMRHFERALSEIDLSTARQLLTEVPDVGWDEVGGLDTLKRTLREAVEWPLKYADRFKYAATRAPKGILLSGAPGTGKTLVAKAFAAESGINFISVKGPELLSKWVGESERGIREIFKKARQLAPAIVFFDEIDALVPHRSQGAGAAHVVERMVGQFMLEMDSIEDLRGVIVVGATNRLDLVDPALVRPGRFDLVIELPIPDLESRRAILEVHCRGRRLADDVSLGEVAESTDAMTGAQLAAVCNRAATQAIGESIVQEPGEHFHPFSIERRHFMHALHELGAPADRRAAT